MSDIRRVTSPDAPEPPPETWSNCLVVGNVAYIAGLTARAPDGSAQGGLDDYEQAHAIFAKIKALVEAAGGTMADVVKINVYVTDTHRPGPESRTGSETVSYPASRWNTCIRCSRLCRGLGSPAPLGMGRKTVTLARSFISAARALSPFPANPAYSVSTCRASGPPFLTV